jgi:hypothetical protein
MLHIILHTSAHTRITPPKRENEKLHSVYRLVRFRDLCPPKQQPRHDTIQPAYEARPHIDEPIHEQVSLVTRHHALAGLWPVRPATRSASTSFHLLSGSRTGENFIPPPLTPPSRLPPIAAPQGRILRFTDITKDAVPFAAGGSAVRGLRSGNVHRPRVPWGRWGGGAWRNAASWELPLAVTLSKWPSAESLRLSW